MSRVSKATVAVEAKHFAKAAQANGLRASDVAPALRASADYFALAKGRRGLGILIPLCMGGAAVWMAHLADVMEEVAAEVRAGGRR